MKKILIIAAVLSLVSVAAISVNYKHLIAKAPPLVLLDSAFIFKYDTVKNIKATPEALAVASKLYVQAEKTFRPDRKPCESLPLFLKAVRTCPVSEIYGEYSDALSECGEGQGKSDKARDLADAMKGKIMTNTFVASARYALADKDTSAVIVILRWCMRNDTGAYKIVDKDEAFRSLENYPDYYYMMDQFLRKDIGQQSSLRTMRFARPSRLPYMLTTEMLFKEREYALDTASGVYSSEFELQDNAISDLMRGNRWGRYSRFVDRDYQYVATLHLSKDFFTYIYSTKDAVNEMAVKKDKVLPGDDVKEDEIADSIARQIRVSNTFYIVNLDKNGRKIAEQQIGCLCSPVHISTASVDPDGLIEVKEMEQVWKKDPLKAGYKGNEIASRHVTAVKHYKVKDNGTIIALSDGATARAQ